MALREILAHFGVEVETGELEKADDNVGELIDKLKHLGSVLLGGEVVKGVLEFAENIAETGDALDKASIRLGVGTDEVQALGFAARQSGAGIENLTTGLLMLEDKVGDAMVNATGEGAKAFAKYGIAIKDTHGQVKDGATLFEEIAEKISDTKDAAKQVTMATDLFGKQGRTLLPLLKEGKDGIAELRKEFLELGGGMSKQAVRAARDYDDALGRLGIATLGLKSKIAVFLLPILQKFVDWSSHAVASIGDWIKQSSLLEVALAAIGAVLTVFAIKSAIAFAPWLAWAAALAGVILIIEDIVTMFRGGDSLMGRFLDTIGGEGFHTEVVKEMRDEWSHLRDVFKEMSPIATAFVDALKWIWQHGKEVANAIGSVSSALGDNAGKLDNYLYENYGIGGHAQQSAATRHNGGRSDDTNVAIRQAGLMNNTLASGGAFSLSEIPAYYAKRGAGGRDEFMDVVAQWAEYLKNQNKSVLTQTPLGMAPGMGVFTQQNEIHVHDAHDPVKTAKVVTEELDKRHAAAADRLHKKVKPE